MSRTVHEEAHFGRFGRAFKGHGPAGSGGRRQRAWKRESLRVPGSASVTSGWVPKIRGQATHARPRIFTHHGGRSAKELACISLLPRRNRRWLTISTLVPFRHRPVPRPTARSAMPTGRGVSNASRFLGTRPSRTRQRSDLVSKRVEIRGLAWVAWPRISGHPFDGHACVPRNLLALLTPLPFSRRLDVQAHLVLPSGSTRGRLPVRAKMALATAGAMGGVPGSPTPVGLSAADGTMCTSTAGISDMRSTG